MSKRFTVKVHCGKRDVMVEEELTASEDTSPLDWEGFRIAEALHNRDCEGAIIGSCGSEAISFSELQKQYTVDVVISEKVEVHANSPEEAGELVRAHLFITSDNEGEVSPDGNGEITIEYIDED